MSTKSNFDRVAAAWLAEGPTQLADRVLDAALDEVHLTNQQHRLTLPWRFDRSSGVLRLATAAVIAVVVLGVIYLNLPGPHAVGGPSPTPTLGPTDPPLASPTATPAWQTFTSDRFGYSVTFPGDFVATPSSGGLPEALFPGDQNNWADRFDEPVAHVPFLVIARATPQPPMTLADVTASYDESLADGCDVSAPEAITVGDSPARLVIVGCVPYSWFDVTVEHDGRLYVLQWNTARASLDATRSTFNQVLASFAFTS
jgi:hypothetical protein